MHELHTSVGLEPINIVLCRLAKNIWNSILNLMPEKYASLEQVPTYFKAKENFPKSINFIKPRPQYTIKYKQ